MNVIRPAKRDVPDIVEVARRMPAAQPQEEVVSVEVPQTKRSNPTEFDELGKDHGLMIIHNSGREISATLNGRDHEVLISEATCRGLFLDGENLYYARNNRVISWPRHAEATFGKHVQGMTKYRGDILVAVRDGLVWSLGGFEVFNGMSDVKSLAVLNGELYHRTGESLFKTWTNERVQARSLGSQNLFELDGKLYFCGSDGDVYSYDGTTSKLELFLPSHARDLCGAVKESRGRILYMSDDDNGILRYNLDPGGDATLVCRDIRDVDSVVAVPLDLLRKFIKEAKQ